MENLSFVIWVLSYNLVGHITNYINYKITGVTPSKTPPGILLIDIIIYIGVAYLLYK